MRANACQCHWHAPEHPGAQIEEELLVGRVVPLPARLVQRNSGGGDGIADRRRHPELRSGDHMPVSLVAQSLLPIVDRYEQCVARHENGRVAGCPPHLPILVLGVDVQLGARAGGHEPPRRGGAARVDLVAGRHPKVGAVVLVEVEHQPRLDLRHDSARGHHLVHEKSYLIVKELLSSTSTGYSTKFSHHLGRRPLGVMETVDVQRLARRRARRPELRVRAPAPSLAPQFDGHQSRLPHRRACSAAGSSLVPIIEPCRPSQMVYAWSPPSVASSRPRLSWSTSPWRRRKAAASPTVRSAG
eukprot:SAG11_NODE_6673_length_1270_cov_0.941076_1_plen_299_part_10